MAISYLPFRLSINGFSSMSNKSGQGAGGGQIIVGGILAYTGHTRTARILQRVSVAPVVGPEVGGVMVGMAF